MAGATQVGESFLVRVRESHRGAVFGVMFALWPTR